MKPNLIIIGAHKCGTTSLHQYLNLHPEVSMPSTKELNFFVEKQNWSKGNYWYESHFTDINNIYGEASPNYTMFPNHSGVPQRMHSLLPDAKLIYIVRDPIERIISHYLDHWYRKRHDNNFEDVLLNSNDERAQHYIDTSNYYLQISQYLKYYDISRIFTLSLEELQNNQDNTLRSVFTFLSIDDTFSLPANTPVLHKTQSKIRTNALGDILLSKNLLSKLLRRFVNHTVPQPVISNLKSLISSKQSKPKITDDVFDFLKDTLQEDINKFREMSGKAFPEWSI